MRLLTTLFLLSLSVSVFGQGYSFSVQKEIEAIKQGNFNSLISSLIIYKVKAVENTGYLLCMQAGRLEIECDDALGKSNVGYGLCMAAGRAEIDCDDALGKDNIGYGLCMAAGRPEIDCDDALGKNNISYGVCMAGGHSELDCDDLL